LASAAHTAHTAYMACRVDTRNHWSCPSDTTDAQWAVIDPLLPDPVWLAGKGDRREIHCRRRSWMRSLYVVDNGIWWWALSMDFPPWSTVYITSPHGRLLASPRMCWTDCAIVSA
jgi:transposase